jgi:ABC-type multidrug transport system fused ATPase/permease subunit
MEIKIGTQQILKILYVLSWIIFIGVAIEAGGFISNTIFTMLLNPSAAKHLWQQVDLSDLHRYDAGYFLAEMILICIVAIMRAFLFYLIVKILHDKKLNLSQPFSKEVGRFVFNVSYLALGIGLFSFWGVNYTAWLVKQGVNMPDIQHLRLGGADVWLFMGVTLLVIAQMVKRGIEIQTENELTV